MERPTRSLRPVPGRRARTEPGGADGEPPPVVAAAENRARSEAGIRWLPLVPADREADFVDRALALPPRSRVLDLGCGFGRHAVPLAALGHRVTGVDLSRPMLDRAARLASERGVEVEWLRRDMRDLGGLGPFDACVCLFTVIGYFDDETNAGMIRSVANLLRPGGAFLLDLTNPLGLMPSWPRTDWWETRAGIARETSRYDPITGRLSTERVLFRRDGRRERFKPSVVRMYAPNEVAALLGQAGFEIRGLFGALADRPFRWNRSPRQVWSSRRVR